jgi:hypothetical protein
MSHEDYSRDRSAAMGSDRSFGLVIAAAIAVISMMPLRTARFHFWGSPQRLVSPRRRSSRLPNCGH